LATETFDRSILERIARFREDTLAASGTWPATLAAPSQSGMMCTVPSHLVSDCTMAVPRTGPSKVDMPPTITQMITWAAWLRYAGISSSLEPKWR